MTPTHRRVLHAILGLTLTALASNTVNLSAQPNPGTALRDDVKARRARLMEKLGSGSMAILWSAPARVYSRDVDYGSRQDSDLLYLTGVEQPETILVLVPGSPRRSEVLFITPPNPRQEHYVGKYLTKEEASARTGIETVFLTTEFDAFLASTSTAGRIACPRARRATTLTTTASSRHWTRARQGWRCGSRKLPG